MGYFLGERQVRGEWFGQAAARLGLEGTVTDAPFEAMVRESRGKKLSEVTTAEVRARQRAELTPDEAQRLDALVRETMSLAPRVEITVSQAQAVRVVEAAIRHVFERHSVAREGEGLGAALELHPEISDWRSVRFALETHPDVLRGNGEMTLRSIKLEEAATVRRVQEGRNKRVRLGAANRPPGTLTRGQRHAAKQLLRSRDFLSLLVGDAGTGKTTVLSAIEGAHVAAGGVRFLPLAPTTRARDAEQVETLVVIPIWDEIERFNGHARRAGAGGRDLAQAAGRVRGRAR